MGDNIQSIMVWGYTQIDFTLQLWAVFGRPLIQENCGAQEVNYWEVMIIKVEIGIKFLTRFIIAFFSVSFIESKILMENLSPTLK